MDDSKQEYINDQMDKRFIKLENRIDKIENKMTSIELSNKEQTIILNQIKTDLDKRRARNENNLNDIIMKIILVAVGGVLTIIGTAIIGK